MSYLRAQLRKDGVWKSEPLELELSHKHSQNWQVDGNLFFTEEKREEYRRRVESVTPQSPRQWGTMEVDQMLHHLNLACGGSPVFYSSNNSGAFLL